MNLNPAELNCFNCRNGELTSLSKAARRSPKLGNSSNDFLKTLTWSLTATSSASEANVALITPQAKNNNARFVLERASTVLPDAVQEGCDGKLTAIECNRIAATIWVALACRTSGTIQSDSFNEAFALDNAGWDFDAMWQKLGFADESGPPDSFPFHTPLEILKAAKQAGISIPGVIDLIQHIAGG